MHNLTKFERAVVDYKILLHTLSTCFKSAKQFNFNPQEMFKFVRNQITLAEGLKHCKYVKFKNKVFIDSFTPHWPSVAFDSVLKSYAGGVKRKRQFIDYAVFAITNRCMYRCQHCYAIEMLQPKDNLTLDDLLQIVKELQKVGIGILSLEGGEPLLRFNDLITLIKSVKSGTAIWIATTGFGLTKKMAHQLKNAGLVGATVSIDHYLPEKHNAFRGSAKAFSEATKAIKLFRSAGIFPVMTIVPSREILGSGGLYKYLKLAKKIGAGMIQILDPMPSGRYLNEDKSFFNKNELQKIINFQIDVNTSKKFLNYPAISSRAYLEDESRYGCGMGGNQYIYVDAGGNIQPCVYLNASFGNIKTDGFKTAYLRMRKCFPHPVNGVCPVFYLYKKINKVYAEGNKLPLSSEQTIEICKDMHLRKLPAIFAKIK